MNRFPQQMRYLTTFCGLIGGIVVGLSLQRHLPPLVATFMALMGALIGVLAAHGWMFALNRRFAIRPVTAGSGVWILITSVAVPVVPVMWLSEGSIQPTLTAALTLLVPTMHWLSSRGRLQESVQRAFRGKLPVVRFICEIVVAVVVALPSGLVAWVLPLMAIQLPETKVPQLVLLSVAVSLGCLTAALVGLATVAVFQPLFNWLSNQHRETVSPRRSTVIALATLSGLLTQPLVFVWLHIYPPNSIQGPGPFMPPFAVAAAVAVILTRLFRRTHERGTSHPRTGREVMNLDVPATASFQNPYAAPVPFSDEQTETSEVHLQ